MDEYKGKAVVYLYRRSYIRSTVTFNLRINVGGKLPLRNNGYYLLILAPGRYNFIVSNPLSFFKSEQAEKVFDFEADKTYYIHFRPEGVGYAPLTGVIVRYRITSDSKDEAIEDLKKCRLIEVPEKKTDYERSDIIFGDAVF